MRSRSAVLVGLARLEPDAPRELTVMRECTGSFGPRTVRLEGDRLVYQHGARTAREMTALAADRFLIEGLENQRIRFERDDAGAIVRLVILYDDGRTVSNMRD